MEASDSGKKLKKIIKNVLIIIIPALVIYVAIIYLAFIYVPQEAFTKEKWNTDAPEREHLLHSLLRKYDLKEMTRNDVISLLGTNEAYITSDKVEYIISYGVVDPILFCITFDENGYVSEYGERET